MKTDFSFNEDLQNLSIKLEDRLTRNDAWIRSAVAERRQNRLRASVRRTTDCAIAAYWSECDKIYVRRELARRRKPCKLTSALKRLEKTLRASQTRTLPAIFEADLSAKPASRV